MASAKPGSKLGLALRVGVFAFLAVAGATFFPLLMEPLGGYMIAAVLGTFASAAVANALVLRIYESGRLADIGLQWNPASAANLILGFGGGAGAAVIVLVPPLALGFARLRIDPDNPGSWPAAIFVSIVLLFGSVGEEMLFRGYAFQILWRAIGPFATILPTAVLFGFAHSNNLHSTTLSTVNTIGWGVLLGVAVLRSGDLWLPIGLHFGWNVALPLFGAGLSGFDLGVTGYKLHWSVPEVWSGGGYGPEGGLLTSIVLAALAVYLWRAPIRGQKLPLLSVHEEQ